MTARTVCVYMPTRNRLDLLGRAIGSILGQTYRDIELVVVDDASSDGTRGALEQLARQDPRLKPLFLPTASGACAARNRAIAAASGRWITGCDDDDYFRPRRIEELVAAWEATQEQPQPCSALYTDYFIEERNNRRSSVSLPERVDAMAIRQRNAVGSQVFTLTETLRRVGGFDTRLPAWQDFDLWLRIITEVGPMRKAGSSSYVMDQSHGLPRISTDRGGRVKVAFELFVQKHGHLYTKRERSLLYLNYLQYEQVPFTPLDVLRGLRAGEFRAYAGGLLAKALRGLSH
jgi:glycosyltransferase involved in cell wall biosynthesis